MSDFSQSKYGYTQQEVDNYINSLKIEYEERLAAQKERIFELVEKNKKVSGDLEHYRGKDEQISSALLNAVSKAREIEAEAELRYENEMNRLQIFHHKWVKYYNEIKQRYPVDDEMMSIEKFLFEMNRILGSDTEIIKVEQPKADRDFALKKQEFLKNYQQERQRLKSISDEPVESTPARFNNESEERFDKLLLGYDTAATGSVRGFNPAEKIKNYISSSASDKPQIGDSGFDMNEVLNPGKKLDLAELCKELGLMDNEE